MHTRRAVKILTTACFTQSSNSFTELLERGIASVAYNINGKRHDLKSCTEVSSELASLDLSKLNKKFRKIPYAYS